MDPCVPGISLADARSFARVKLGVPGKYASKMSALQICKAARACKRTNIMPPMEYHAVNGKMYLLDPKSPISIKDFLSLLGNGSDDAIKKIARELELVTEYISKKELKSNIIEMLQSLKISEPIEIPSKRNVRNRGFVSSNNGFVSVGGEGEGGVSPRPLSVGEEGEGGVSPRPLTVGGEEEGVSPGPLSVGGGEGGVSPGPLSVGGGGGLKLRPPNPGKIHESSSSGSSSNNSNWRKNANDTERELSELRHKVNNQSYSPPPSSNNNNNNNNNNSRYNRVSRIVNDTYGTKLDRLKRAVG